MEPNSLPVIVIWWGEIFLLIIFSVYLWQPYSRPSKISYISILSKKPINSEGFNYPNICRSNQNCKARTYSKLDNTSRPHWWWSLREWQPHVTSVRHMIWNLGFPITQNLKARENFLQLNISLTKAIENEKIWLTRFWYFYFISLYGLEYLSLVERRHIGI